MSKVYDIGLKKYREEKIRICDKNSIPLLGRMQTQNKNGFSNIFLRDHFSILYTFLLNQFSISSENVIFHSFTKKIN